MRGPLEEGRGKKLKDGTREWAPLGHPTIWLEKQAPFLPVPQKNVTINPDNYLPKKLRTRHVYSVWVY